ncbi:hypothetical protein [Roseovarius sp. TE539]|uniref:hypothetical protein n=1 Tax=Roseovarius sp. TE539 TaxID=2249812 RepID=UPI0011BEEA64|nr:hypothetical protein [Roseovarius sp. TE539]
MMYTDRSGLEVFAPGSTHLRDYAQSVAALIATIAESEDRDEISVFRDLAASDRDLIRFRAPEADGDGSIDLIRGVDLVQQSKDAVLAAACSTVSAQRFFRSGSNARATEYLETVKLGQTEHGSFVVTLYSPVPPSLDDGKQKEFWPELESEPFGRKVTRTLVMAMDALLDAVAEVGRGSDIEAFERVVSSGVSANLCSAVSKFISDGEGLDFSLSWARTRPTPESRFRRLFSQSDAEILSEAARILKDRQPFKNEVLSGYITGLNREIAPTQGRVKLRTWVEGSPRSVTVELPAQLYSRAIEAHDSKAEVQIEGDLEFRGQRWHLVSPRNLEIKEERDD